MMMSDLNIDIAIEYSFSYAIIIVEELGIRGPVTYLIKNLQFVLPDRRYVNQAIHIINYY